MRNRHLVMTFVLGAAIAVGGVSLASEDPAPAGDGESSIPVSQDEIGDAPLPPAEAPPLPEPNRISDYPVADSMVARCGGAGSEELQGFQRLDEEDVVCRAVFAKAAGKLPPGDYSDEELGRALDQAERQMTAEEEGR